MKLIFLYFLLLSTTAFSDTFWASEYLSLKQALQKWGDTEFKAEKFKEAADKEKRAMATNALKNKIYVGKPMLLVRKDLGSPDSYFFSDTIYAYEIDRPKANKESWQLIFIPDENLENVKEIKIRKKCCYKSPL